MRTFLINHLGPVIVLALLSLVLWPLFLPGYFSHHDDLHVMRIFEMRKCLADLQIPCRWVSDMGYGNGYPLFNYYAPLPYYIGALLSFILGLVGAAKALFFISLLLSAVSMYILSKEVFGKESAVVAAVLYTFAPFRALDSYTRGALAESLALAIIPLVFYFSLRLLRQKSVKYLLCLAVSLAAFLISHNIMALLFLLPYGGWVIFWVFAERQKNVKQLIFGLLLGFGLAAFFILPAYLEKDLVQTENLTRFSLDFRAHFLTLQQLFFDRHWGYGLSGEIDDQLSFQIGWPHWWVAVAVFLTAVGARIKIFSPKFEKQNIYLSLLLFAGFIISLFMTHNRSAFIWERIEILKYVQFPWRFLALSVFFVSLSAGFLTKLLAKRYTIFIQIVIVALTVAFNWFYFRPEKFYYQMTDSQKLSGAEWEEQQRAAILDYLPRTAVQPFEPAPDNPLLISGQAKIVDFEKRSNLWRFTVVVEDNATIEVPVFDFPKWQVQANGMIIPYSNKNYLGRINFILNPGNYRVVGQFRDTLTRSIANYISLFSLFLLLGGLIYAKRKKIF